jgi:hypothetical protein
LIASIRSANAAPKRTKLLWENDGKVAYIWWDTPLSGQLQSGSNGRAFRNQPVETTHDGIYLLIDIWLSRSDTREDVI